MEEYISRKALLAEYDRVHIGPPGGARKLMVDAPAVDVVEVVRCKDCIKGCRKFIGKTETVECQCYYYMDTRKFKDPMDFCSHGARKEQT